MTQDMGRTGLKELHSVTNHLLQQFGREYVVKCMDNVEDCVPARITSKLNTKTPEPSVCGPLDTISCTGHSQGTSIIKLVDQYLTVIAESYGISWSAQGGHPEVDDQSVRSSLTPLDRSDSEGFGAVGRSILSRTRIHQQHT